MGAHTNRELSVVVVSYRMVRELPRTIRSLARPYQRGIARDDYEVIVVDNGTPCPPCADDFADLDLNLKIVAVPAPTGSPVPAINLGLATAAGGSVGVLIDGARIASPELLATAREALRISDRAFVGTRGRYLGPDLQWRSMARGYDPGVEDALLARIGWEQDGDRLFAHSVFDESSGPTWFDPISESNAVFLPRALWDELGGYDPGFASAGGGLANLDLWSRACELPGTLPVVLLGEATFHQVHGGISTNSPISRFPEFNAEYRAIRGRDYCYPTAPLRFWGRFRTPIPRRERVGLPRAVRVWRERFDRCSRRLRALRRPGPGRGAGSIPPPEIS